MLLPRIDALFEAAFRGLFREVEMATIRLPTNLNNGKADLFSQGRDIPNDKTDAFVIGAVGVGAMDDIEVVKRHFAGLQRHIDGLSLVENRLYLLASVQEIISNRVIQVSMLFLM